MTTLLDLVGASLPLKRRGRDYWAPCPFHNEKTSSFKIGTWRDGKQRFMCFGCGARGDAADWLMRTRGVDYKEAKRILGEPVAPDPALIAKREARQRRERAISAYRDGHPDCGCPDWLLE